MRFPGSNLETVNFWEPLGSRATACVSSLQRESGLSWQRGKGWSYLRKALGFVKFERFSTSSRVGGRGRGCYDTSGWRTLCPGCDLCQQILSWGGFRWPWGTDTLLMVSCFLLSQNGKSTLQPLNVLKMSMFSWIIPQFSRVQKCKCCYIGPRESSHGCKSFWVLQSHRCFQPGESPTRQAENNPLPRHCPQSTHRVPAMLCTLLITLYNIPPRRHGCPNSWAGRTQVQKWSHFPTRA